jgi:hypothetical protein
VTAGTEAAHEALLASIQRVAEAARDLSDSAEPFSQERFLVQRDAMCDVRDALKGWSAASEGFLAAVHREVNGKNGDAP